MSTPRPLAGILGISLLGIVIGGCDLLKKDATPTAPSAVAPPAAGAPIHYTALGASDANGVGGSVACLPFTPCDNGTGYVPVLARQLRATHEVTLTNLGTPAAVLSPAIETLARQYGREVTGNFVDRQMPFVPRDSTLVTIFGGPNDGNAIGDAMLQGAAGADVTGYIDAQARAFGADYDRLVRGVRSRAPGAFVIVLTVPNLAAMPYAARYPLEHRRVLQASAVALSREANRQAGEGVVVMDVMCDPAIYGPAHFSSDGFHPNDAGYAHLASRLAAIVNGAGSQPAASCAAMTAVPPR
ncbi:MAG: SGNH/GDSL hydrolase family protein [Acidobacteria bacterium]|nr:SGNH/GDSL hydrolase family protein [Acidobacteriota bacterium]